MRRIKEIFATIFAILISCSATASLHKTISSEHGLSNNAIFCLYQNELGHIYIGTADGLNIWDGNALTCYNSADGYNYFFGNTIKHMIPNGKDILYAQTSYGVAKIHSKTDKIEFFRELEFFHRLIPVENGKILALDTENNLQMFDCRNRTLTQNKNAFIPKGDKIRRITATKDGKLGIFSENDSYIVTTSTTATGEIIFTEINNLNLKCLYVSPTYDSKGNYILTDDRRICFFDCKNNTVKEITRLRNLPNSSITSMVPTKEGLYIGLLFGGLHFLPTGSDTLEPTDINYGILSMIPDKNQPILWIGTDGNGLIRYSRDETDIVSLTYDKLMFPLKMPVRSILVDKERTLWFGTKGDGLIRVRDFDKFKENKSLHRDQINLFHTQNSSLASDAVYALTEGSSGTIWIGTGGNGLNFWSHRTNKICKVPGSDPLSLVHSIAEGNDSTLWIGTDGDGAFRCRYVIKNEGPVITDIQPIDYCEPFDNGTCIFSASIQNDTTIWFGSRVLGALSYNPNSRRSKVLQFPTDKGLAINEIFYIEKADRMLFATGNGLVMYSPETSSYETSDIIPQKAVHGIVCDKDKNVWVSTNSGLISLDSTYNYRLSYNRFSGLDVLEYADGACCYDRTGHNVIFGGINGITIIGGNDETDIANPFIPKIHVTNLIHNNHSHQIDSMMHKGRLTIPYSKSIFGIQYSVVDHLHYPDYEFRYRIDGYDSEWITTDRNIINIPTLKPGNYQLRISYFNKAIGYESEDFILPIRIKPPFYSSWWAYSLYILLTGLTLYSNFRRYRLKHALHMEKMQRKYSKEITKVVSETTSSINEEISVQLTFIIGLCQQIRQTTNNNPFVADKVNLVEYNIGKINKTLHMFNEYKNISELLINTGEAMLIPICQTMTEIIELMKSATKTRNVSIDFKYDEDVTLALKKEAFLTMLYSLFYKVISVADGKRNICVRIQRESEQGVVINIALPADEKTYDKLRASSERHDDILEDDFDLMICNILISMMGGSMKIGFKQETGIILMAIHLASLDTAAQPTSENTFADISENINIYNTIIGNQLPRHFRSNANPDNIYIVSSNRDISSFLGYFLSGKYNVHSFKNNKAVIEKMESSLPLAVIYDVYSMPDELKDYLERIKGNKRQEQVTTVVLTSAQQVKEREEYTMMGADLCISFPFNMNYLTSVLEKIIQKKKNMADFHKSSISTFTIESGRIIHQDDKEFMNRLLSTIDENISNPRLTAAMIAGLLGTSLRVMYRKLENVTDKKLHQIIREARIGMAATLLTSTKMSVDEIMYKVGYDTRSTFFRNFKEVYGKTPKEYRDTVHNDMMQDLTS